MDKGNDRIFIMAGFGNICDASLSAVGFASSQESFEEKIIRVAGEIRGKNPVKIDTGLGVSYVEDGHKGEIWVAGSSIEDLNSYLIGRRLSSPYAMKDLGDSKTVSQRLYLVESIHTSFSIFGGLVAAPNVNEAVRVVGESVGYDSENPRAAVTDLGANVKYDGVILINEGPIKSD
jgi:hypothetical protein